MTDKPENTTSVQMSLNLPFILQYWSSKTLINHKITFSKQAA